MIDHIAARVLARAAAAPDAPALRELVDGEWVVRTYADVAAQGQHVGLALVAAGLQPGDAVAIVSDNRVPWLLTEMGVLAASGVVVHLGPSTPVEELATALRDTETRVAFVSGEVLRDRVGRLRDRLPSLRLVICYDEGPEVGALLDDPGSVAAGQPVDAPSVVTGTSSWQRLMAAPYDVAAAAEAQRRRGAWDPDDIAFVDYTLGSSGDLRGVVRSHRSALATARGVPHAFGATEPLHHVTTLPLHHGTEHCACLITLVSGGSITVVRDESDMARALREQRPNMLMTTMPVLRSIVDPAVTRACARLPRGDRTAAWARDAAVQAQGRRSSPRGPLDVLRAAGARALVGRPLSAELGGPKAVFAVGGTGAQPHLLALLELAGLPAHRCWGLPETGAITTTNAPGADRAGSVGRPLDGVELRIDDDGEVLVRGPGTMRGYFGRPAVTRRVLRDGWVRSGQEGRLDDDGYLHLTNRLDDLIVTESLHYVAPHVVETRLRAMPEVTDVVVVGDERPCLVAIVEPDLEHAHRLVGRGRASAAELAADPTVVRAVGDAVRTANAGLAPDQRIRGFRLSASPLHLLGSPDASSYVRRQRVERSCAEEIEQMYADILLGAEDLAQG